MASQLNDTKCSNCGTPATMNCAGCLNAPEYIPGDAANTIYCNRECQSSHWPSHKPHCNALHKRTKLLRAAVILKAALLTYRERVFDIEITKMEFRGGVLYLHQSLHDDTVRGYRGAFPGYLTSNEVHGEAAMAYNQCTAAMALLSTLMRRLLSGLTSSIRGVDLQVHDPPIRTKLIPGPDDSNCPHTVLKVERRGSSEQWIIDPAGCQYGFREVLIPLHTYLRGKDGVVPHPALLDWTETKDLDFFSSLPFLNSTAAMREDRDLDRRTRLHFADFVDRRVGNRGRDSVRDVSLLDGSADEFQGKLEAFVQDLKLHMTEFCEREFPVSGS